MRSCKYWQEFEKPKIVIPTIVQNAEYAPDYLGYFSNDKTCICVPKNINFVLAILNSSLMWWFIKQIAASKQGGFFELKPMYVSQIPIPTATEAEQKAIEILVGYVLHLTAALKDIPSSGDSSMDKLMTRYFEQIINAAVMELYLPEELHEHDKQFMRHLLSENLPNIDTIKGDKIQALREIFNRLFDKDHPIRVGIFFLDSIPVVRTIRGLK